MIRDFLSTHYQPWLIQMNKSKVQNYSSFSVSNGWKPVSETFDISRTKHVNPKWFSELAASIYSAFAFNEHSTESETTS